MSRPGWFALRVLAATALSFGLLAPASFGQALSLSGESLESTRTVAGQETTFGNFTCDKSGTTTITFQTNGAALGPYSGTFTETGSFTIGPQMDYSIDTRGVGPITDFQATFTINSTFPVGTVTGSKQLSLPAPTGSSLAIFGSCDPNGSSPPNDVVLAISNPYPISNPYLLYNNTQINAATGSRTDSGTASVAIRSIPSIPALITFEQVFNSTEPVPCEDGNNGNGMGGGHEKKRNDNDDNEVCP
jgi:hypothetical protein